MLQKHDRPDDRLEALLRLWGAEQAARMQDLPPAPPVLKPVRLDLRYALVCAGCVAAGAIVAIGALLLAKSKGITLPQEQQAIALKTAQPETNERYFEAPSMASIAETQPDAISELPLAQTDDSERLAMEEKLAEMQTQRDQALSQAKDADAQLKILADKKAELEKQVDQSDRMKQAIEQLNQKIESMRKNQDEALAMASRLRKQLAADREQNRAKLQQMLEVHLQALAPNQQGLHAIQTAARTSSLLLRCAELRAKTDSKKMRALLDRIEATLLQLDFLDTNNVTNMIRFEHQMQRSDLLADIAASLPQTSSDRELQIFLAEVDLILSGVQRVG